MSLRLPRLRDDFLLYLQSKEGLDEAMQNTTEDFKLWVKRSTDRLKRLALERELERCSTFVQVVRTALETATSKNCAEDKPVPTEEQEA